jgi:hypothetical protein
MELAPKVKPNINLVEVHPQLSNNGHPVDGALEGARSLWRLASEGTRSHWAFQSTYQNAAGSPSINVEVLVM